ncbi:sulfite exporter TauE/SafE family protein [Synechococcus sp. Nb3U1]|uniref:nickel/cobalt transporter n=1 Tax=Synechococcus sp. Nb3U1 TaxID=1914529 RepID=UPI001F23D7CB|nr:sulfite exporter TauE/SafE family protein [Synechococcus sp. Nb3U1]MCF2972446.1 sulfite exporter TauE/SafE family protein [Synechococcus sp. Nb3U1]
MLNLRRCWLFGATLSLTLAWATGAFAHPLGNFTINHYAGLDLNPNGIHIDYVLDMAEIPAFQEIRRIDLNRDQQADPTESQTYAAAQCDWIGQQLVLQVGGQGIPVALQKATVEYPPGVGELATLRLGCEFEGSPMFAGADLEVLFADHAYEHRLGWREITLSSQGIPVQSQVPSQSISQRLQAYPAALLKSPPLQRQVSFLLNPSGRVVSTASASPSLAEQSLEGRNRDGLTRLITLEHLNPLTILVALGVAFVWGGFHALTPGHGKTVVGAYLVGSRGTALHALILGLTTTFTHMAGILALGGVALLASQSILSEQIYPWLSMVSGLLVVAIGLSLGRQRWQGKSEHSGHPHPHPHPHGHSHLPHQGSRVTWASLFAVGISGGLLPCPSALVVLLSAIALGKIGFGLALVLAFSLGLAGVLTAIGLLLVYAKSWLDKLPTRLPQSTHLSTLSALIIALVGLGMTHQALVQLGVF